MTETTRSARRARKSSSALAHRAGKPQTGADHVGSVVALPQIVEHVIEHRAPLSFRRRILIAALSAVSTAACRPLVMTPAASKVAVASAATEVQECKPRGKVFALAPFRDGDEPLDQLKIRADVIGADTLLVAQARDKSAQTGDWQARAYRCREKVASVAPALELSVTR